MDNLRRTITWILGWTESTDWLAPLLMRLFFGYFWIINGWGKIHDLQGFVQRFAGWGIPYPHINAALSAYTELVGGVLIFLGLLTRLATLPMMFNMLVAIITVTSKQMHSLNDFILADEPLYILILFWLLMVGPGKASLDRIILWAFNLYSDPTKASAYKRRQIEQLHGRNEPRSNQPASRALPLAPKG